MSRTRIYRNPPGVQAPCDRVVLTETYHHSAHWTLHAYPKAYGVNPEPWIIGKFDKEAESGIIITEGYGIFRIEIADSIARALTGAEDYADE